MFKIDIDNNIRITKGDTATFILDIEDQLGEEYVLQEGDLLTLTVRKNVNKPILIQKTSTDKYFGFNPEDTNELNIGFYEYDIQLSLEDGSIYTVVTPRMFEICKEITY